MSTANTAAAGGALKIIQLYPEELGVAGDRGNVMALTTRLQHAGIAAELVEHRRGDAFVSDADLVVIGSGPLSAMRNIYDDLLSIAPGLMAMNEAGVPIFAYGSGAELLGSGIVLLDGTVMPGLGILPFRAVRTTERQVAYIITEIAGGQLVGFEDHASRWELDSDASAFGKLVIGGGNGDGEREGVLIGTAIGTQVGGPVLPLNPMLTDALLGQAAERRGFSYNSGKPHAALDRYAKKAREVIVRNASYKFNSI